MKRGNKFTQKVKELLDTAKRYTMAIIIVSVVVLSIFIIGRPLVSIITTYLDIRDLEKEKAIYVEQIQRDSLLINNLKSDEFLERYAREKYNMQRKNEEVFIVE